jgi:hypothetical protein
VNFIQTLYFSSPQDGCFEARYVKHLTLNDETETGSALFPMINTKFLQYDSLVMLMSLQPGYEHSFGTTYRFYYQKLPWPILK